MSRNSNRMARKAPPEKTEPTPQELSPPVQAVRRTANTEFVELPSRGMFYPKNHPLHGQEVVEIRFMTARDEDILTSPALLREGVAIDKFIQNILVDGRQHFLASLRTVDLQAFVLLSPFPISILVAQIQGFLANRTRRCFTFHPLLETLFT